MKANNSYPKLSDVKNYSRPKSFSEGYKLTNQFPKQEELVINQDYNEIPEQRSEEQEPKSIGFCAVIYTKIIGFLFHLVLISIFELLFFNYYIIHYEDNALISLTNQLINPVINSCKSLSNNNKIIVDDFINIFVNYTIISSNALNDYNSRQAFNYNLYIYSICYSVGVIMLFLLALILNYFFKQKIDYKMIILDNLIMICILGVYEFIFFNNIIFKYMTISPNELIKMIMTNLLTSC